MVIALIIGLLLILFIVFILFSKVKFELQISVDTLEVNIKYKIKILYGLIRFKKGTTIKYHSETEGMSKENSPDYFSFIKDNKDSIQDILMSIAKEVKMTNFKWLTVVGLGEATGTCILAGIIWSIKSVVIQFSNKYIVFKKKPIIDVNPNVLQYGFQTKLLCMSDMRAGKAIVIGIKMHKEWKNIRREMVSHHLIRRTAHV